MCRVEDKQWIRDTVLSIANKTFNKKEEIGSVNIEEREEGLPILTSIPPLLGQPPHTVTLSKRTPSLNAMPTVQLTPIDSWRRGEESLRYYMSRFNEEGVTMVPLKLELSEDEIEYISSIHRALKHAR